MKRREAVRTLDAVFTELTDQLTKTRFEATFVTSRFKDAIVQLEESLQTAKEFKKSKDLDISVMGLWVALPVVDLTAPKTEWFSAGKRKAEEDELLATLIRNLNTQHQWLVNSTSKCTNKINSGHDRQSGIVRRTTNPLTRRSPSCPIHIYHQRNAMSSPI